MKGRRNYRIILFFSLLSLLFFSCSKRPKDAESTSQQTGQSENATPVDKKQRDEQKNKFTIPYSTIDLPKEWELTGKLDKNNPADQEVLNLVKNEVPKELKDFYDFHVRNYRSFLISDDVNTPSSNSEKKVTYHRYDHIIKHINKKLIGSEAEQNSFSVHYSNKTEQLEILEARRIRKNGEYKRIEKNRIVDEATNETSGKYINLRVKRFTLTDVEEGDFLEIKTGLTSWERMGDGGFGDNILFGSDELIKLNETNCYKISSSIPFNYKLTNETKITIEKREEAGFKEFCFKLGGGFMEKMPDNALIDSTKRPHLMVSTWNSWDELHRWYKRNYHDKFEPGVEIKNKVHEITGGKSGEDGIREIYHFIEKNISYSQLYFNFDSGFVPRSASEIFNEKTGDCKDKTTLFISMLKEIGIRAYPVLIADASGFNPDLDFAMLYQFNHMITYIDLGERGVFLDPTDFTASYPYLSASDQNRNVLIFRDDKIEKSKTPGIPSEQKHSGEIKALKDGDKWFAEIDETYNRNGYFTSFLRQKRNINDVEMKNTIIKMFDIDGDVTYKLNDMEDYNENVILNLKHRRELIEETNSVELPDISSDFVFYNILLIDEKTEYPMNINKSLFRYIFDFNITLPDTHNYSVELPQDISINNDIFQFDVTYKHKEKLVEVSGKFNLKRTKINPSEIPSVVGIVKDLHDRKYIRLVLASPMIHEAH